jgi:hypothetical protein
MQRALSEPGAGRVGQAGKAAMHTAAGGIHPRHILPLALDVGCDSAAVREDPFYVGLQQVRRKPLLCGNDTPSEGEPSCSICPSLAPLDFPCT